MLKPREQRTADYFGITEKLENFKRDLLKVPGVADVEFDLHDFYYDLKQLIFLPQFDINVSALDYFEQRRQMIAGILETAKQHGLTRTADRIEDYGTWLYFVCHCNWDIKRQPEQQ